MLQIQPLDFDSHILQKKAGILKSFDWEKPFLPLETTYDFLVYKLHDWTERRESILVEMGFFRVEKAICLTCESLTDLKFSPAGDCRRALSGDKADLQAIAEHAFTESRYFKDPHISHQQAIQSRVEWVLNALAGKRGELWVLELQNQVVGFHILIHQNVGFKIDLIGVHPHFQNKGLGRALIAAPVFEYAPKKLDVITQASNLGSLRFYQRLGFQLQGCYYSYHWHRSF